MAKSRRDFMRGDVINQASLAQAGGKASVDGHKKAAKKQVITHECDVLVVGGGIAGMEAALRVVNLGQTAIILDKGVFGHSGSSGMNWGHTYQSMEYSDDDDQTIAGTIAVMDMVCEGLLNQPYFYNLLKAHKEEKIIQNGLKYGSIPLYNEDGTVLSHNTVNPQFPVTHDQGFWPRMMAQWCQRNGNVTEILDHMYVVDILFSKEGHAAGAVAIDMVNGMPHVFRAKATIMATGSYCWITGWNGMGAESMAARENTGDGIAILLRHGVPMADMEQFCGDASQWTPMGVRQTMGNFNFDASQTPRNMIYDKDMVSWEEMMGEKHPMVNMGASMRVFYGLRLNGRTTENGGCYINKDCAPAAPRYFRRVEERQKAVLDYQLPQYVEVVPETWDSAGCPRDLSPNSETIIPGLFFAGAAPGGMGGMTQLAAQSGGWIAANGAVAIAKNMDAPPVDESQVQAILDKTYSYLENNVEDSIRANDVIRKIQTTYWDRKNGPLKDEKKILEIIEELNRIKEEDLPRMCTGDKSHRMNVEWRDCFEAENMLYCALGASYAGLIRKESRGFHMRTDYPDLDNSIGLKNTVVKLDEDGNFHTDFVPINDQLIPSAILAQMVPSDIGLNTFANREDDALYGKKKDTKQAVAGEEEA